MSGIDLKNLPRDPWDVRSLLVVDDVAGRVQRAVEFLQGEYEQREVLEECRSFIFHDLFDTPRADIPVLTRVWFFPWTEIQNELGEALSLALLSSYKAVYDNCRRALELALVGTYFVQENVSEDEGCAWMRSERETPLFSRALRILIKNPRFAALDAATGWHGSISAFYWRLCDIVHVRGESCAFRQLQPSHFNINSVSVPEFSQEALIATMDTVVETSRHIATIVATENPILLVPMPMEQKFGLNPPLSGFFEEPQAERIRGLLIPAMRPELLRLSEQDQEVRGLLKWIHEMPDITDEQVAEQIRHQKTFLEEVAPVE